MHQQSLEKHHWLLDEKTSWSRITYLLLDLKFKKKEISQES
jgi:hypothetical protein